MFVVCTRTYIYFVMKLSKYIFMLHNNMFHTNNCILYNFILFPEFHTP